MSDSNGTGATRTRPPASSTRLAKSSPLSQMVAMHNPIQLAAISNYKLAQLTFSPPNQHALRKTALIKNMLEMLYEDTPPEWLDQMTRWEFFTPESLSDMTQESLEVMFAQYAQTIEAFQPLRMDEDGDDESDGAGDAWVDEEVVTATPASSTVAKESAIFSQIHATVSSDTVSRSVAPLSMSSEKPLPKSPTDDKRIKPRSSSLSPSVRSTRRLSWTSDTGLSPTSSITQSMATEMMSLFDMDFKVDIMLNTAPKLPELPFNQHKNGRRQSNRYSNGSLLALIPAFETFGIQDEHWQDTNGNYRSNNRRSLTVPPPPNGQARPTRGNTNMPPRRSSSLKYRQHVGTPKPSLPAEPKSQKSDFRTKSNEFIATFANALMPSQNAAHAKSDDVKSTSQPTLSKKKSLRRLASLMSGKREKKSTSSEPPQVQLHQVYPSVSQSNQEIPHKSNSSISSSSTSTSTSMSSSSEIFTATVRKVPTITRKPVPGAPTPASDNHTTLAMARPIVTEVRNLERARSLGHKYPVKQKNRRSLVLMETTASKRKSLQLERYESLEPSVTADKEMVSNADQASAQLSRSKSAYIKIGGGSSSQQPLQRQPPQRHSSLKRPTKVNRDWKVEAVAQPTSIVQPTSQPGFVKRMATLGQRMKLQKA